MGRYSSDRAHVAGYPVESGNSAVTDNGLRKAGLGNPGTVKVVVG